MEIGGPVDRDDLQAQVAQFKEELSLSIDDAFVVWFLRAYIVEDEKRAVSALTGNSGEKGIDAVYIDDDAYVVHLVQGKFADGINKGTEKAADITEFADWAADLYGSDQDFAAALDGIEPSAKKLLERARDRLTKRERYRLVLYWVTTRKVSGPVRTKAETDVHKVNIANGRPARFEFVGGTRTLEILHDYMYGVAPAVPFLELPVASTMVRLKDPDSKIVLRVFMMKGDELGALVDQAGLRLFALNIRSYLHNTRVNRNMRKTIKSEPRNFLYFNNGVTFVCDAATGEDPDATDVLTLTNPQIINGQQTTRVLNEAGTNAAKAGVMVRVIVIPRGQETEEHHEQLITQTVQATNWQNAIKLSDLKANDVRQIHIERGLRRIGNYVYDRKNETTREIKARVGKNIKIIRREELARAVAGCKFDSLPLRGQEALFDDYYEQIFDQPMRTYLCCYWFALAVKQGNSARRSGKEQPVERKRGQWIAMHHAYNNLNPIIKKRQDIFIAASERPYKYPDVIDERSRVIRFALDSAARFYRKMHVPAIPRTSSRLSSSTRDSRRSGIPRRTRRCGSRLIERFQTSKTLSWQPKWSREPLSLDKGTNADGQGAEEGTDSVDQLAAEPEKVASALDMSIIRFAGALDGLLDLLNEIAPHAATLDEQRQPQEVTLRMTHEEADDFAALLKRLQEKYPNRDDEPSREAASDEVASDETFQRVLQRALRQTPRGPARYSLLFSALVTTAVSSFEILVGAIYRQFCRLHPEAMGTDEVRLSELMERGSVKEVVNAAISRRVDDFSVAVCPVGTPGLRKRSRLTSSDSLSTGRRRLRSSSAGTC
jgi:AIPR protein